MLTLLKPGFPHRHNPDGSHDSICTVCLATVATVQDERELGRHESAHLCEPINLYRIGLASLALPRIFL
jgi:hypothetical protein